MVYSATTVTVLFTLTETILCAYYYTEYQDSGQFVIKRGKTPKGVFWLARAYMAVNQIKRKGWGYLEIETSPNYPDMVQAYQAGFLEGTICSDLIYNYWEKYIIKSNLTEQDYYPELMNFFHKNTEWLLHGIKAYQRFPTWLHLCLLYKQIEGIYQAMIKAYPHSNITYTQLILLHAIDELPEILTGLEMRQASFGMDFGTSIVKRHIGYNESTVFVLHSKAYVDNVRFQKKYILPYNTASVGLDHKLSSYMLIFTSLPGIVTSEDGFYLSSANLVVTRTAIDTAFRVKISEDYHIHLGFPRAFIATRLANTSRQWFVELCCFTGSTYSSEYTVLDYNRINNDELRNSLDTVMLAYDIPGNRKHLPVGVEFLSGKVITCINVPKSTGVYQVTNQDKNVLKYGVLYSYGSSPRLLKVQIYEDTITSLDALLKIGQFNITTDTLHQYRKSYSGLLYPKTVVYTKMMNSMLQEMFNFAIVGYPDKGIVFRILPSIMSRLSET